MNKTIIRTIFYLISFIILLITLNLLLDHIFRYTEIEGWYIDVNDNFGMIALFVLLSYTIGLIGIVMNIYDWIKKKEKAFYLKSLLFAKIILLVGITILIII